MLSGLYTWVLIATGADISKVALKERGIDKMLEDAREDHKESDALHMRRQCKL